MVQPRLVAAVLVLASVAAPGAQATGLTRADADSMRKKIEAIEVRGLVKPDAKASLRPQVKTSFTENELNSYFKYAADVPPGLTGVQISLLEGGRVSLRAVVDLDAVRRSQPRGKLDPMSYMTGSLELKASATIHAANGQVSITLESATIAGVPVPQSLAQSLLSTYTKTPDRPEGFRLDTPFPISAGIQSIEITRGSGTIIQ